MTQNGINGLLRARARAAARWLPGSDADLMMRRFAEEVAPIGAEGVILASQMAMKTIVMDNLCYNDKISDTRHVEHNRSKHEQNQTRTGSHLPIAT